MSMFYRIAYTIGFHPWEDAEVHPRFVDTISALFDREEAGRKPPYGRALDLGCGSGIWGVHLAKRGWDVTGVDIVPRALRRAQERVRDSGTGVRLVQGDVTDLRSAEIGSGFRLVLDSGTFLGLPRAEREAMGREVDAIASPDATVLLLVWRPKRRGPLPRGASRAEVEAAFPGWEVTDVIRSHFEAPAPVELLMKPGEHWYRLRRHGAIAHDSLESEDLMTAHKAMPTPHQIRDGWDPIAPDFDRFTTPITLRLAEAALDRVGLEPGMRFLDIAAGSGALAIPAARRGARVLATDIAPTMIERLRGRAREEGLSNLEARVMDGHSLDLEDDSFDLSASQNGVSLFPDLKRGLREMVRVTRPGGRAMIVTFGPMRSVEFVNFFMGAVTASVPGFEGLLTEPPPLPFQVADPGKLRREMTEAGLSDVRVEGVDWPMEFRSGSHFWDTILSSNPIAGAILSDLTEEQTREVRRVTDGMIRERFVDGPAVLHNRVNIGIGTK